MEKVNIHQVAEAAGTSTCTVSKVMNNQSGISDETRRRVINAANRLGYRSVTGGNRTIAVIVGNGRMDAYQTEVVNALLPIFSAGGYHLEIVLEEDMDILNERAVAGAIAPLGRLQLVRHWQAFSALPMVSINGPGLPHAGIYSVSADTSSAIQLATERLWRSGHRKIGFISPTQREYEERMFTRRYPAYCDEMRRRGIPNPERLATFAQDDAIKPGISRLLDCGCTAAICVDGTFGIVAAKTLRELGRRIPEDFSLISWESPRISEYLSVPQTTCEIDYSGIAVKTFEILDASIRGRKVLEGALLPFRLIERESVGAPPEPAGQLFTSEIHQRIYSALTEGEMSRHELAEKLGMNANSGHLLRQISNMRKTGRIEFSIPDHPRSRQQKLRICRNEP